MPEKDIKKKPEIPQPRPDIVLPDDNSAADLGAQAFLRMPSPRGNANQEGR